MTEEQKKAISDAALGVIMEREYNSEMMNTVFTLEREILIRGLNNYKDFDIPQVKTMMKRGLLWATKKG